MILPARCEYCGTPGAAVCAPCVHDLPWNLQNQPHEHIDHVFAAFRLQAPVQAQIHALKYQSAFRHAQILGTLMARRIAARPETLPQILIPVPLHASRLRSRGFNQSLEIARAIHRALDLQLLPQAARRIRDTEDQIGKSAVERRRNVRGAFEITRSLDELHVALLDDAMTTGATLTELAKLCRAAGAARVEAWALAQAPLAD